VPPFTPFDRRQSLKQTWRRLPHWDQPDATYFVTFRLADSLPVEAQARLAELRRLSGTTAFAETDRYLDCGYGRCLLSNPTHSAAVAGALRHFDGSRYFLGAYAVMPNHVHALVQPLKSASLSRVLHQWKSYSARKLQGTGSVPGAGAVWQDERYDRIVRNEYELRSFHDYILGNPAAARLKLGSYVVGEGQAQWLAR
jgi:hypothetical protein